MLLLRCVILSAIALLANTTNCPDGLKGENGLNGFPGRKGSRGHPGPIGDIGFHGLKGLPGPKGDQGTEEDLYLEGAGEVGPVGSPGRNVFPSFSRRKRGEEGGKLVFLRFKFEHRMLYCQKVSTEL